MFFVCDDGRHLKGEDPIPFKEGSHTWKRENNGGVCNETGSSLVYLREKEYSVNDRDLLD